MKSFFKLSAVVVAGTLFIAFLASGYKFLIKAFYPLKYETEIISASDKYGLEIELICAIIKTESNFDENAESHVGAIGLMQLMPETFNDINSKLKENSSPLISETDIYKSDINIDYGCCYLKFLLDRYGVEETAVAAYNAGPGNVDNWLKSSEYSADGKILSKIPFPETERYVKKVCNAKDIYKKIYFERNG